MKKFFAVLAILAMFIVTPPAFASGGDDDHSVKATATATATGGSATGGAGGSGGAGGAGGSATIQEGAVRNNNTNIQGQFQLQGQGQKQEQEQGQGQVQGQFGYVNVEIDAAPNKFSRPNLSVPEINPIQPVLIPGGLVDVTSIMPNVGLKAYKGEEIEKVAVKDGNFLSRIRLEDAPIDLVNFRNDLVNEGWDLNFTRIQVYTRTSSSGFAIGGGGQAGASALDPTHGTAGMTSASVLPSYSRSTADPRFTMIAYLLKGSPAKKAAPTKKSEAPSVPDAKPASATAPAVRQEGNVFHYGPPSTVPPSSQPLRP